MAAVTVVMSADDAKLRAAHEKLLRDQQRILDRYKEGGSASSKAGKEAVAAAALQAKAATASAKAERDRQKVLEKGKALTESLLTPQEKYNQEIKKAIELKDKGAISADTLQRKFKQLKSELRNATGETERNSRVEKARLDVLARSGSVTDKAKVAIKQYEAALKKLDDEQNQGKISAEELAVAQKKVRQEFEDSAGLAGEQNQLVTLGSDKLAQYASAAGLAAVAVGAIKAAWKTVIDEQDKGLNALKATEDSGRALLQISDSPEQFSQLKSQAQALASSEGVDVAKVERVMFSAVSEGFVDAVPDIIAANQVLDPEAAAGVAGQVPTLFKGAIGPLEAVNLTLKAARDSRLNFEQIGRGLPGVAEGGSVAGASVEESLAAYSVLAGRFKSGDVAGDRLKGFATKTGIDEDFRGLGIIKAVEKLQGMSEGDRSSFLGESQELNTAYIALTEELALIKQRNAEFIAERTAFAAGGGILRDRIGTAGSNPALAAVKRNNIAQQQLDQAYLDEKGLEGADADTASKALEANLLRNGSFAGRAVNNSIGAGDIAARGAIASGFGQGTATGLGGLVSESTGGFFSGGIQGAIQSAASAMVQSSESQREAARAMQQNANSKTDAARAQAGQANQGS